MRYAQVAVPVPVDRTFDYSVPPRMDTRIAVGKRVRVPFGHQRLVGTVVGITADPAVERTRPIDEVLDAEPVFDEHMLLLTRWISDRYWCSWGEALAAAAPSGARRRAVPIRTEKRVWPAGSLGEARAACESLRKKAPKQAAALEELLARAAASGTGPAGEGPGVPMSSLDDAARRAVRTLSGKGLAAIRSRELHHGMDEAGSGELEQPLHLKGGQRRAAELVRVALESGKHGTILLHGVTASGKTEVYLQAIAHVLAAGKQAIVLVPEISLTYQTMQRFRKRFGGRVALLHSQLSPGRKSDEWTRILKGEATIVLGPRSAVFAPTRRLGLIVVDEEHENSYKQSDTPRYHARDVAAERARLAGALLLLGTATPSLESYHRAVSSRYQLSEIPDRVDDRPLASVEVVDMRGEWSRGRGQAVFSAALEDAIREKISSREQVILFLNRRGHSTFVMCRRCGEAVSCKACDVSLTYHSRHHRLRCHYCNHEKALPEQCPSCGSASISYSGIGTQRVEREAARLFPEARIARMDSDTTRRRRSHDELLRQFDKHEIDILVGTQMIAKGLDFPQVTLVGIISADTCLHLPDFRSAERTFQLMTQVAGRAGRGQVPGQVIIQTFNPDHYSIRAASQQDYHAFYSREIAEREELEYPPFRCIVRVLIQGSREKAVIEVAGALGDALGARAGGCGMTVLGPAPALIARLRGLHRWSLLLKGRDTRELRVSMKAGLAEIAKLHLPLSTVRISADVDPVGLA